ncbi:MAG: hypothetical protein GEU75_07225 [Dehalococcoidia bacterium]|nr:hypothetical protein [Dehalococcoidia bacterium]
MTNKRQSRQAIRSKARRRRPDDVSAAASPVGASVPLLDRRVVPAGAGVQPPVSRVAAIGLQQTLGNRATRRLLRTRSDLIPAHGTATKVQRTPEDDEYDDLGQKGRAEDEARQTELDEQDAEDEAFIQAFELHARLNVINMLLGSYVMVQSERKRYGISMEAIEPDTMAAPEPAGQIAAGGENEGLAAAAAQVADAVHALYALYAELEGLAVSEAGSGEYDPLGQLGREEDEARHIVPHAEAGSESMGESSLEVLDRIEMAKLDYELTRAEAVQAYPILAMYAPELGGLEDSRTEGLSKLAQGPSPEARAVLAVDIAEKLDNIKTTREAIASGALDVWTLPRVVAMTKKQFKVASESHQDQVIENAMSDAVWDDILGSIALAALGIGFGLAAFVTGGGTAPLAAQAFAGLALGISAVLTVEEFQDYMIESAAAGTDFDKAKAIVAQEPAPIWLALAVISAVIDVIDAVRVVGALAEAAFKAESSLARLRAAGDVLEEGDAADEVERALQALRDEGNVEMPGLGDTLVDEARGAEQRAATGGRAQPPEGGPTLDEIRKGEPAIEPGYGPPDISDGRYINNNPGHKTGEVRVGTELNDCAARGELPGIKRVEGRAEIPGKPSADFDFVTDGERRIPIDLITLETNNVPGLPAKLIKKSRQGNGVVVDIGAGKSGEVTLEEWGQVVKDVFATPDHDIRRIILIKDGKIILHEVARG